MKCSIPEISWHNREPVLSADFQPLNATNNDFYRLATGGSDNLVLIWKIKVQADGHVVITILSELSRHQRAVNCVKWSPNGELLASADDDANIILWQLKTDNIPSLDEADNEFEEKWNTHKVLRGHKEDVYDLCWSSKGDKLVSGSVDNTAILWDVVSGKSEHIIKDHKGFIQGVAWDPKSDFLATLCSDRVCRVFDRNGRRIRARILRGKLPVDEDNEFYDKEVKFFHDDTFKTYFRRLSFTPDGSLLLVPSGAVETDEKKNALFATFAFTLDGLSNPAFILPSDKQCSIAVSCCPVLFTLREDGPQPLIDLPYRMIIAVATDSDVFLYDTQQSTPCVHLQNIHYTRLTDLTWTLDGHVLAASSTDGYITLVTFEDGELGIPYVDEDSDIEDSILNISGCDILANDDPEPTEEAEKPQEKHKKLSFLEQWTKQTTKRKNEDAEAITETKKTKNDVDLCSNSNSTNGLSSGVEDNDMEVTVTPVAEIKRGEVKKKRITPILISKDVTRKSLSPPKLSPQVPIKSNANLSDGKPKKRIQPIKIGEVGKPKEKTLNESKIIDTGMPHLEKMDKTPKEVDDLVNLISDEECNNEKVKRKDIESTTSSPSTTKIKRIQPITIGHVNKSKVGENKKQAVPVNNKEDNEKVNCFIKLDSEEKTETSPTAANKASVTNKSIECLKSNEQFMEPITPNTKGNIGDLKKSSGTAKNSTPKSNTKKTPAQSTSSTVTEKTSAKKQTTPVNSLLNYLKPISKTSNSPLTPSENGDNEKKDFKPQKLFNKDSPSANKQNKNVSAKLKVSSLIRPRTKDNTPLTLSEDTTTDLPEDFVLKVDDDVIAIDDDSMEKTEKENELEDTGKVVDNEKAVEKIEEKVGISVPLRADAKRRIPLITLSSPKNKKKLKIAD